MDAVAPSRTLVPAPHQAFALLATFCHVQQTCVPRQPPRGLPSSLPLGMHCAPSGERQGVHILALPTIQMRAGEYCIALQVDLSYPHFFYLCDFCGRLQQGAAKFTGNGQAQRGKQAFNLAFCIPAFYYAWFVRQDGSIDSENLNAVAHRFRQIGLAANAFEDPVFGWVLALPTQIWSPNAMGAMTSIFADPYWNRMNVYEGTPVSKLTMRTG